MADRPGVGERVSPFSFIGPKRFHPTPLPLQDLPPIAGLILSHDHYDHLDEPTIQVPAGQGRALLCAAGRGRAPARHGCGVRAHCRARLVAAGATRGVEVTATPSQHFSGRTLNDRNSTLWASWVLQTGGQRIYYSGDTGYFPGFKAIGDKFGAMDLALMEKRRLRRLLALRAHDTGRNHPGLYRCARPGALQRAQQHLCAGHARLA
ncbi:MBL fold metallo-hydrolase [Comamonas sp. JC664]|uniref:MBL fold metallo-hydrolase n=1 Tax=Comamonas sp. JC664 TaxID=2801917 RepID=UPI003620346E